jgi:hypothetical protein
LLSRDDFFRTVDCEESYKPEILNQFIIAMTNLTPIHNTTLQQWVAEKLQSEEIKRRLKVLGYGEEMIDTFLREYKKVRYAKRRNQGFILMGIGALIGFIGCLLSIINPIPSLYYWLLYGFTSISIVIVVMGMYYVVEG